MLTCNLWTSKGLVNGAQSVVKKIWFDQGSNSHSHLKGEACLNSYTGGSLWRGWISKGITTLKGNSHGEGGIKILAKVFEKDAECFKTYGKISKKNGSEIFNLKTPWWYISTNIAQIAFGVVGIDFGAQFASKIKLQFFILVLLPP
jgi:hypothetical protein